MEEIVPNKIEEVYISIEDGLRQVILPITMNGEQYTRWKRGRGGVFYRDVFLWNIDKPHGKYILMEGEGEKSVLRLIEDDEIEDFEDRKLISGKVKDKPYMKLIDLAENGEMKRNFGYIEQNDQDDITESESMIINPPNIPLEDEEANSGKSISLFDD